MGTLVRQELHSRSSLYKQIANVVNEGKLVPEEVIFGLLSKRLEEGFYRGETGFILDGIPRTRMQAISFEFAYLCLVFILKPLCILCLQEILDQVADIELVLNFKCTDDCLQKKWKDPSLTMSICQGGHLQDLPSLLLHGKNCVHWHASCRSIKSNCNGSSP